MASVHRLIDTILLDSKDRESASTSSANFLIKFPTGGRKTNFIHIRKIIIPLAMDNISSTLGNDSFELDDVVTNIPAGQWTIGNLMDYLTTNVANYTFTFDDNSRVTVTNTVPTTFKFEPLECANILGFTASSYTGAATYTAERFPNLLPTNYITMHSNYISQRQHHNTDHSDKRSDTIALIEMKDLGELLVWEPEEQLVKHVSTTNSSTIDFDFRDDTNTTIDIQDKNIVIILDRIAIP